MDKRIAFFLLSFFVCGSLFATDRYVDPAAGNDYAGATMTDGSFANATNTLTKIGAFAATVAKDVFYIEDNGSGEVTAGYYAVTTVNDDDSVVLASDIRSGANDPTDVKITQHDGTSGLPWKTTQKAVNISSGGDWIGIKAGSADVLTAAIAWTTGWGGGTSGTAPLIISGYTSSKDDGGIGEIDGNDAAATIFNATSSPTSFHLSYLKLHNTTSYVFDPTTNNPSIYHRVEFYNSGNVSLIDAASLVTFTECYFHGFGTTLYGVNASSNYSNWYGNYFEGNSNVTNVVILSNYINFINNIITVDSSNGVYINGTRNSLIGNTIIGDNTSGKFGIANGRESSEVIGNIIVEFGDGTGGGVDVNEYPFNILGYNQFYNNVSNYVDDSLGSVVDLTANDTTADPQFTNAAGLDFSVGTNAKAKGWPTTFLGTNTTSYVDTGAVQREEPTGGGGETSCVYVS